MEENEIRERLKLEDMSKKVKFQLVEFRSTKSLACREAIMSMAREQIQYGEQVSYNGLSFLNNRSSTCGKTLERLLRCSRRLTETEN